MQGSRKVSAELTREQVSFLEDLEKQCNGSGNTGISKTSILRCLVRLFEDVHVDVRGVGTEDDLLRRSLNALREKHS